jgi:hypothetical protein
MMEAARTSETSVDNYFTRQYIPEDKSELRTRRRENLKSHDCSTVPIIFAIYTVKHLLPQNHFKTHPTIITILTIDNCMGYKVACDHR